MLPREEYVEQAYFFKTFRERMTENAPMQDLIASIGEEVLSTTKLPLAIGYLKSELRLVGQFSSAMARLPHYFTPFQTYVVSEAEKEGGRFDFRIALEVLEREAEYRAAGATPQGSFMYQFETLCRNRLGYDRGLEAISRDSLYDEDWSEWILAVRRQVGLVDFADLVYARSALYRQQRERHAEDDEQEETEHREQEHRAVLFGEKEGKIALANRQKDPLFLFSALQRHLSYPAVPRPKKPDESVSILPLLVRRMERVESRLKLLEEEQKGGIDITKFYGGRGSRGEGPGGE